jgi:hypothetical protein
MAEKNQKGMTRTQRRKLQKEKRQAERKRKKRKKQIVRWSAISLAVILSLAIGYVLFLHKPDTSNRGVLRVAKPSHYFGVVSSREGISTAKIPLVNIGEGALTITGLDSSCGCTSASILNNGVEGPRFKMASHGKNPRDWSTVIKPGEQAFLKVYYDPAVHPSERGQVTRIVWIFSDDPVKPKQEVKIKVVRIG